MEHTLQLHLQALSKLCRVCGHYISRKEENSSNKPQCSTKNYQDIETVYGITTKDDNPTGHSRIICWKCFIRMKTKLKRSTGTAVKYLLPNVNIWLEFNHALSIAECSVCTSFCSNARLYINACPGPNECVTNTDMNRETDRVSDTVLQQDINQTSGTSETLDIEQNAGTSEKQDQPADYSDKRHSILRDILERDIYPTVDMTINTTNTVNVDSLEPQTTEPVLLPFHSYLIGLFLTLQTLPHQPYLHLT